MMQKSGSKLGTVLVKLVRAMIQWVAVASLLDISADATTWYASTTGAATNGSYNLPWSVEFAVGATVGTLKNVLLKPGDTVIFKNGGSYACRETNTVQRLGQVLEFRISGTPSAKITYKPESLWGFSFDGGLLLASASNIVVREFRIFYSGSTNRNRTDIFSHPPGINELTPGNEILHNLIENTGHPGIGSWRPTRGKYIAGNIIRFTGYNDWTEEGYNGGARGSGMYLQNMDNSAEALIRGNISYCNYTTAMKAYGNTEIWGFKFLQNICVNNQLFYHQDQTDSQGFQMISNFVWGANIQVGYVLGNAHPSNAVVAGNYVVNNNPPIFVSDDWRNMTWSNNIAVNPWRRIVWELGTAGKTNKYPGTITLNNQYWGGAYSGYGSQSFLYFGKEKTFAEWKTLTGGESNSTYQVATPSHIVVSSFRPSHDTNFVHVAVVNWPTNTHTTVDLSGYFHAGDRLMVFDAQDLPNAYTNVIYEEGGLVLDLTRTNTTPMLGTFSNPPHTWSGFDPRFRAFVINRRQGLPPPLLHPVN